jgi:hypothetical protein
MLIERDTRVSRVLGSGESLLRNIFICERELLSQQSPVSIAQHIRSHMDTESSSASYEGWLVDSLPTPKSSNTEIHYPDALICTTLSLPILQGIEARFRNSSNIAVNSIRRICSINSIPQQDGALSVDMQLPVEEIERFKFRYGDSHSVPPAFYEN